MRLKGSADAEAYVSDKGYLVISQEDLDGREQKILLSPEQAAMIGGYIRDNLNEMSKAWCSGLDKEE